VGAKLFAMADLWQIEDQLDFAEIHRRRARPHIASVYKIVEGVASVVHRHDAVQHMADYE
jgi:hypothetical protein